MNLNVRNFVLWGIIFVLVLALVTLFQSPATKSPVNELTYSQLRLAVDEGGIRDITLQGRDVFGHFKDGRAFRSYAPDDPAFVDKLYASNVSVTVRPPEPDNGPALGPYGWVILLALAIPIPVTMFIGWLNSRKIPMYKAPAVSNGVVNSTGDANRVFVGSASFDYWDVHYLTLRGFQGTFYTVLIVMLVMFVLPYGWNGYTVLNVVIAVIFAAEISFIFKVFTAWSTFRSYRAMNLMVTYEVGPDAIVRRQQEPYQVVETVQWHKIKKATTTKRYLILILTTGGPIPILRRAFSADDFQHVVSVASRTRPPPLPRSA